MASTVELISGFETNDFSEWTSTTGSPSVQGTIKNTGSYSMEVDTTGGAANAYVVHNLITQETYTYISMTFYLRIDTAPGDDAEIAEVRPYRSGFGHYYGELLLTTDRYLQVESTKGSTQLSTGTQYRIDIESYYTDAVYTNVWINGNSELSAVQGGASYSPTGICSVGLRTSTTAKLYFDDVVAKGDTSSIGDLDDLRVLNGVPVADGSHEDWKDEGDNACSGTDCYDSVNTVGQTADYVWFEANGSLNEQTFTSDTCANLGIGISDTVEIVSARYYYKTDGGGGTDEYFGIVRDNGSDYTTSVDDPKTATWVEHIYETMPNGGGAWTQARCDALEFGMATDDVNKDHWFYSGHKKIVFIPAGGVNYNESLSPGLTVAVSLTRDYDVDRALSPGLTVSALVAYLAAFTRSLSPGLDISTTISKSWGRLRSIAANLSVSTTISRQVAYDRSVSPGLTATVQIVKSWGRTITTSAANLAASVSISIQKGFSITLSPGLTIVVSIAKSFGRTITTSPGLNIGVTISRVVAYTRSLSPGLDIAVQIVKSFGRTITTTANLTIDTVIDRVATYMRSLSPGLNASISITRSFGKRISLSPGLTISVTISRVIAYARAITANLTASVSITVSYVISLFRSYIAVNAILSLRSLRAYFSKRDPNAARSKRDYDSYFGG